MLRIVGVIIVCLWSVQSLAHHVLGRPAYSLNEDSNTPPSMQVETQIGKYFVNYMVFPAFPKPNQPGRISLYATTITDSKAFDGIVTFSVRDDSWFSSRSEILGEQPIDDAVYHQGFQFEDVGDYIITASFEADGEPYVIDFPLRIGEISGTGPIGILVGIVVVVLIGVNVIQRRRVLNSKIRQAHERENE
ncbi:MAG: hypothetical protein HN790_09420 [Methylococcales bacterium]|jgi:hypothetical protein|nr:hypothetical protein [Methylococcales bacterium]